MNASRPFWNLAKWCYCNKIIMVYNGLSLNYIQRPSITDTHKNCQKHRFHSMNPPPKSNHRTVQHQAAKNIAISERVAKFIDSNVYNDKNLLCKSCTFSYFFLNVYLCHKWMPWWIYFVCLFMRTDLHFWI